MNPVIFREYDIRGVYNSDFDLEFAENLGKAFVSFVRKHEKPEGLIEVTLGHDARLSSPDIVKALTQGMVASGAKVYQIGMVTSPISYFSTFEIPNVSGGIMVTGSHNPPEYNGFKISVGKTTIHGPSIKELYEIIESKDYISGDGSSETYDIFPQYVEKYKKEFSHLKDLPVVLDCGNGAAGVIARKLYEACGLKPIILFEEPDGTFPNHHPDPTVEENLVDLKKAVLENKAVVGIGFDGDADRIGVVGEMGQTVFGDELMVLVADDILKSNAGAKIVGDVKCSDRLYEFVKLKGGLPIMWKTGHSLIKDKIRTEKAPFGGELSGHIFFADRNYGYDDALYAGLRVIEILSNSGKTISELLSELPEAFNTPEIRIDTTEEKKHLIVEALKKKFHTDNDDYKVNLQDGLRVSFKNGWALARASNTQPVLVLRFEADSDTNLKHIEKQFRDVVDPLL